jgi:hypothetical protein
MEKKQLPEEETIHRVEKHLCYLSRIYKEQKIKYQISK